MLITNENIELLKKEIEAFESKTSGEVRIIIRKKKPFFQKMKSIKEIAESEFINLKMQDTKRRNGVLLYICEHERQFQIVADIGVNSIVQVTYWNELAVSVSKYFQHEEYFSGLKYLVNQVGNLLAKYFPNEENNQNELSNDIIIQ